MAGLSVRSLLVGGPIVGCLLAGAAGCSGAGFAPPRTVTVTHVSPAPTRTIVASGPTYPMGTTGSLRTAQRGVGLTMRASGPAISTQRLSSTYGYAPARGYYVTVTVALHNTGTVALLVDPGQFYVDVAKLGKVTTVEGNAPYSGASQSLDRTQLGPGETLQGQLTFDVSVRHGTFVYAPGGSPALSWTY